MNALRQLDPDDPAEQPYIDEVAKRLLQELVWFSAPVGLGLAFIAQLLAGGS